jgi:hypothetical protein
VPDLEEVDWDLFGEVLEAKESGLDNLKLPTEKKIAECARELRQGTHPELVAARLGFVNKKKLREFIVRYTKTSPSSKYNDLFDYFQN